MEFPELLRLNNVKMLIERDLNKVYADDNLLTIIQSLNDKTVSYCLVIEKSTEKYLGMITEHDLLEIAKAGKFDKNAKAKDFAKEHAIRASINSSIASIVKKMYKSDFRHVIIEDENSNVQGVVSVRDFVTHLIEYFPETVYNVLPGQKRSTEDREGA